MSGSRFVTTRPAAERSCCGEDPGTWGSGCLCLPVPVPEAESTGEVGREAPVGQRRKGSVSVAHTVSPAMRAAARRHVPLHGCASGPVGAGETDTACD